MAAWLVTALGNKRGSDSFFSIVNQLIRVRRLFSLFIMATPSLAFGVFHYSLYIL